MARLLGFGAGSAGVKPLLWLLCNGLLVMQVAAAPEPAAMTELGGPGSGVQEFWSARLLVSDSPRPPSELAAWQQVALPDRWRDPERYAQGVIGWYRFELPAALAPVADEPTSVYLWRFNMAAEIWFNGQRLAVTGSFSEPVTRNWNHPLLVDLPSANWRPEGNQLDVRLRAYPHYGALAPIFVGPRSELEPAWRMRTLVQNDLSLVLLALTLTLAAVGFALWVPRRNESVYLLFALSSLAYSVFSLNLVVRDLPVDGETWWWIANTAVEWWVVLQTLFGLRLIGLAWPRVERALIGWGLIATGVQIAVDLPTFAVICNYFHLGSLLITGWLMVLMVIHWRRTRRGDLLAFALGIAWILILGVHDLLMNAVVKVELWRYGFFLLNLGAPLVFLAMAWHLIRRYADALAQAEFANASLEARVVEARSELDQSYAERRALEMAKAAGDERERIYRDLHDDVGARLLSLIYTAQDEPSKAMARDALGQLRELVAQSDAESCSASELGARLASEVEARVRGADLDCHVEVRVVRDADLSATEAWHLARIVREAVSNAIRHAGAACIRFEFVVTEDGVLQMSVLDDGGGIVGAGIDGGSGHGVRNMHQRARELGGELDLASVEAGGTRVSLRVQLASQRDQDGVPGVPA